MAKLKLTKEQTERLKERRAQIWRIFGETLDARRLNECEGPNNSTIEFWYVGKKLVLVQCWNNGDGWDFFIQGDEPKEEDIIKELKTKCFADSASYSKGPE